VIFGITVPVFIEEEKLTHNFCPQICRFFYHMNFKLTLILCFDHKSYLQKRSMLFKTLIQAPLRVASAAVTIPARGKKIKIRRKNYPPKVVREPNAPVIPYQRFDKTLPAVTSDIVIPEPLSMKSYYDELQQQKRERKENRQIYNIIDLMTNRDECPVFIDRVSLLKKCLEKGLPIPTMTYLKQQLKVLLGMDFIRRIMLPTNKGRAGCYFVNTRRTERGLQNKEKRAQKEAQSQTAQSI